MDGHARTAKLSDLLDSMVEETSGDKITLGDLLDALHTRSYGPLLLIPAVIAASPVGAIPGMSLVTGSLIILLAVQLLIGQKHPWLPGYLLDFQFKRKRLTDSQGELKPWLKWAEKPIQERLTFMTESPFEQIVAAVCILLAITFYPLALVPGGVFLPAAAICFIALGMAARDGLLMLIALGLSVGSLWAVIAFWPF